MIEMYRQFDIALHKGVQLQPLETSYKSVQTEIKPAIVIAKFMFNPCILKQEITRQTLAMKVKERCVDYKPMGSRACTQFQ